MSVESVVFVALCASGAASSVANADSPTTYRVYPVVAPQTTSFPLIVYDMIAQERAKSLGGGVSDLARTLVQVDCYAHDFATALAMADAVTAALDGNFATFKGIHQNRQNIFDADQRLYRVSQDFAVWA